MRTEDGRTGPQCEKPAGGAYLIVVDLHCKQNFAWPVDGWPQDSDLQNIWAGSNIDEGRSASLPRDCLLMLTSHRQSAKREVFGDQLSLFCGVQDSAMNPSVSHVQNCRSNLSIPGPRLPVRGLLCSTQQLLNLRCAPRPVRSSNGRLQCRATLVTEPPATVEVRKTKCG
jgi:hypothetical protein